MVSIREAIQIAVEIASQCSGPKKKKPISQELSGLFTHIAMVNAEGKPKVIYYNAEETEKLEKK